MNHTPARQHRTSASGGIHSCEAPAPIFLDAEIPFGTSRRYSRILGYLLSTLVYALYCVWQFVYAYGTVDFRYLLLMVEYLPMSLALTWCYDNGGSIWSPIALHMVINTVTLVRAL